MQLKVYAKPVSFYPMELDEVFYQFCARCKVEYVISLPGIFFKLDTCAGYPKNTYPASIVVISIMNIFRSSIKYISSSKTSTESKS